MKMKSCIFFAVFLSVAALPEGRNFVGHDQIKSGSPEKVEAKKVQDPVNMDSAKDEIPQIPEETKDAKDMKDQMKGSPEKVPENELQDPRPGKNGMRCFGQDGGCCTKDKPCNSGEGDCDVDSDCLGHLICGYNTCPNSPSPFDNTDDCCDIPKSSVCKGRDAHCCTPAAPCFDGDGDCDSDDDCFGQLVCGKDNCVRKQGAYWDQTDDCCTKPKGLVCKGNDGGCCTKENPCFEGDGDCDDDNQCYGDLKCGTNNCARKSGGLWDRTDDCCYSTAKDDKPQITEQEKLAKEKEKLEDEAAEAEFADLSYTVKIDDEVPAIVEAEVDQDDGIIEQDAFQFQ